MSGNLGPSLVSRGELWDVFALFLGQTGSTSSSKPRQVLASIKEK